MALKALALAWSVGAGSLLWSGAAHAEYLASFSSKLEPKSKSALTTISIEQKKGEIRELAMRLPSDRYTDIEVSAGDLDIDGDEIVWEPPKKGGELTYTVSINSKRDKRFDSVIKSDWALFRFEDIFPSIASKRATDSSGVSTVLISGPSDWSIETRYGRMDDEPIRVDAPLRQFDQPTGWLIAGLLGVRRDTVKHSKLVVAAPENTGFPRVPTLAFLRWTLPEVHKVFPGRLNYLLIVSGDKTMWRGALSGPSSVYLHPGRPLISENGTSTPLHEVVHVATRMRAAEGDDWIVEGIAEYYSLQFLLRSGGISKSRYEQALSNLKEWSDDRKGKLAHPSSGPNTAYAVLLFSELDIELRKESKGSLDEVVRDMLPAKVIPTEVSRKKLQASVEKVMGKPSGVLEAYLKKSK